MKATNDLHQLIRSMSMSEKRYFKIHASRHVIGDSNNYIRLFDAIERQSVYDEDELRKKFANESFIRHLASEKHYLYNQVLDSLNYYNRNKTYLSRHSAIVSTLEILLNRGLYDQCRKLIKKAKKESYELEKFSTLLMFIRCEIVIDIKDEDERGINRNINESIRISDVMRSQLALMQTAFTIQIRIDKGTATLDWCDEMEEALENAYPARPEINSFWSRYYYQSGIALLSAVRNDQSRRYECFKEIKKLMDASPQFIVEIPGIYHLNSNNLVNVMFYLKKYGEAEALISQQRRFLNENGLRQPSLARVVFINTCESELFLYYKTKRPAAGAAMMKKIESEVKKMDNSQGPILYDLLFFMAVTELVSRNYKNATRWLNRILNTDEKVNLRKELIANSRLLFLIVLFESHDKLFENRLVAMKRYLAHEPQFVLHSMMTDILRLLAEGSFTEKKKSTIKKLFSEIRKESKRATQATLNKQFDFYEWAEQAIADTIERA
jgi:hypothetical protein